MRGKAEYREKRELFWFAALGSDCGALAALYCSHFGGEDLVGYGVAGALEGPPHVPTGDGAVGAPALAERQEFLRLGHVFLAVGYRPAFLHAQVVDGEYVGTAEVEDQEHLDGPRADTADGIQPLDQLSVGQFLG